MSLKTDDLKHIKPGYIVERQLGHGGPVMELRVSEVSDGMIHCGPWKFDANTGGEIDEDLGWTAMLTGAFIKSWRTADHA